MSVLSVLGLDTAETNSVYGFNQQQKDFIKLQFKYALGLKNKLAAGQISQAYYDANVWLTTETLDAPYAAWWTEFKTAIDQEDLNWLAKQVGETVEALTAYMGTALRATASAVGGAIGTVVSSTTGGLASGFLGSLDLAGWLFVGALGFGIYYAFKQGYVKKLVDSQLLKFIP
jgi:hypothetical protein